MTQFFVLMSGLFVLHEEGEPVSVNPHQVYSYVERQYINISGLPKRMIEDRSKTDWFAKSIACLQITWLLSPIIERAIQPLPITPLEFFTLAYISALFAGCCALFAGCCALFAGYQCHLSYPS